MENILTKIWELYIYWKQISLFIYSLFNGIINSPYYIVSSGNMIKNKELEMMQKVVVT
jgi:hypothetical protein